MTQLGIETGDCLNWRSKFCMLVVPKDKHCILGASAVVQCILDQFWRIVVLIPSEDFCKSGDRAPLEPVFRAAD
jgi:hypothetical protein